jgi:hypothetical protein
MTSAVKYQAEIAVNVSAIDLIKIGRNDIFHPA